jgi:dipeptide/tripeptide permease
VGLELAFAAAPASMKSLITAFWLAMVSLGNLLNTRITPLYKERFSPGDFFAISAVMMIAVAATFALLARRFNRSAGKLQQHA